MSTINDGGPAFPRPMVAAAPGMTLRDWFAGQALVSMGVEYTDECHSSVAECAYAYADAMLRARG
jgi:hypothetical protein